MPTSPHSHTSPHFTTETDAADRRFLRHTLATLAYRAEKPLRDAPPDFAALSVGPGSRTAGEIVAHMADLIEWSLFLARGEHRWKTTPPTTWEADVERFFGALLALDAYLASDAPLIGKADELFQGPIADSLTHTGQLNMLRRLAESPIRAENYVKAEIRAGHVGREQARDRSEFR